MRTVVRIPGSLFSLVIDIFTAHCLKSEKYKHIIEALACLPNTIKNEIITKFTTIRIGRKYPKVVDLISVLINEYTIVINLTILPLSENVFTKLIRCKRLRCLSIRGNENDYISSMSLEIIFEHLSILEILVLKNIPQVTDKVIENVAQYCPRLKALDLSGCTNITDDGFISLAKLSSLTWMKFSYTEIGDESIAKIVQSQCGSKIKELRIDGCKNITENGIIAIAENCSAIEVLIIENCCRFSDSCINRFQAENFPNLKELRWTITW